MIFGPYSLNRRVKNWYACRAEKTCLTAAAEVQYPKPKATKKRFRAGAGRHLPSLVRKRFWPHIWPQSGPEHVETADLRAPKNIQYRAESTGKHHKSPQKIWFKRLGAGCRRFESCHSDQTMINPNYVIQVGNVVRIYHFYWEFYIVKQGRGKHPCPCLLLSIRLNTLRLFIRSIPIQAN